ncbi:MAG: aminotransferase class V-fold PLP-dependent enzyme [Micromonosporaceae bacterium]|nr:aminotransferase class V-fold PLP-dependent enzyme [Micromonosporaceae bacterium]
MSDVPGGQPTDSALDPAPERIREMGAAAVEWAAAYQEGIRDLPVAPRTSAAELKAQLAEPLPAEGRDFEALMERFRDVVVPGSRHSGHPRFFGYVSAPGVAVASVADFLASALNANLPAWRSAPAPTELEHVAVDWIRQALGCDEGAGGLFTSGGSMANFTALAAARHRHCGDEVAAHGAAAHPKPLRIYTSAEAHHSIHKAAALLGIGRANVREIPVDERFRMRVDALSRAIEEDRAAGLDPFCVVASAGTVVTGAVDPLASIAAVAQEHDLWLHVDACYGGFARLAPSARPLFDGLSEADSIALDPHKWLYLPADVGCLIYRNPEQVKGAFALGADYTRVLHSEPAEAFAFWDYGPDLSRRFKALKVWMTIAHVGADAMGEAIESNLDRARHAAALIDDSDDFELMAPVELSIFCFRHVPASMRGRALSDDEERELDKLNERIMLTLQQAGSSYLSNASIHGRFALRGCVLNYRTTRHDMEILLDDVRGAAATVPPP